jgi:hypothetical protein
MQIDHRRKNCWLSKEARLTMNEAMRRSVADARRIEDVFVLRIGPEIWNVCRWNTGRRDADSVICSSEEAATLHAHQWASGGSGQAWLVRSDGSMAPIE